MQYMLYFTVQETVGSIVDQNLLGKTALKRQSEDL